MTSRILLLLICWTSALAAAAQPYDVVLSGGRVMDPESGLDAVRNVGITGDRIVRISPEPLTGKRMIDAKGLVVAPGFIDVHQHAQDNNSGRLKAFDGVTTGLEMEIGVPDVASFLQRKKDRSLINYGTTASHGAARSRAFGTPFSEPVIVAPSGAATNQPATPEQIQKMEERLNSELDAGALGIGMGIQYTPGATHFEVIDMFRLAARRGVPVFTHVRSFGRLEPGSSIEAVSEVIGAAAVTGASLQIAHINSSCIADALECIAMVAGARARGLDVTTEAYPYIAGFTNINSALFNPGWREKLGLGYDALQMPDTGERLTKERFDKLHADPAPQEVLIFMNTQAVTSTSTLAVAIAKGIPFVAANRAVRMSPPIRAAGKRSLTDSPSQCIQNPVRSGKRFCLGTSTNQPLVSASTRIKCNINTKSKPQPAPATAAPTCATPSRRMSPVNKAAPARPSTQAVS